jgi:uncharacterized protein (TIGR02588 family)
MERKTMSKSTEKPVQTGKNALEWAVFALSLLLVGAVLSFLGYDALSGRQTPPRIEISLGEPMKAANRVLVPIRVENRGRTTAGGVEIEVTRRGSDETSHFSLSHLPRGGTRHGWVSFEAPLRKSDLDAQVLGYEAP